MMIKNKTNRTGWYRFLGIKPGYLLLESLSSTWKGQMKLNYIAEIRGENLDDNSLDLIRTIAENSETYFTKNILVHCDDQIISVDPESIVYIEVNRSDTNFAIIFGGVGIAIDIAVILWLTIFSLSFFS